MAPTLYHVPKTISSPIVQALSILNLIDNPIKVETLTFDDLKSREHLARNPMGSSPAFVYGNIEIWESGAVLTYLLETYDTEGKLHPQPGNCPPAQRAKFLHLQQYIIATVYPFLSSLYIHTLKPEKEQDQVYVRQAKAKWRALLGPVLVKFLGDAPYFMGDQLTVIDLLVAKPLNNVNSMSMLKEFPTLDAVFQKVSALPSFAEAYNLKDSKCVECFRSMRLIPSTH
jgi:glutathione S-transferase